MEWKVQLPSGREVRVSESDNLRKALREHWDELYHSNMKRIHCRGLGTCGTCAMHIKGKVSEPTSIERWRLNFPPHKNSLAKGIRLMCQCYPKSDIVLHKEPGYWGQGKG
jgi:ferredoxin